MISVLKRRIKSIISVVLVICLLLSATPVLSPRVQAVDEPGLIKKTLPLFTMNQIYARGLMLTGMALSKVAEASGSEDFQKAAAIINKFVFGNNTTAQDLAEIKAMCNTIIAELDAIEKQLNGIEQSLAEGEISSAYGRLNDAWLSDVETHINAVGGGALSNMLKAYKEYIRSAYSYRTGEKIQVMNQQGEVTLVVADEELVNYWDSRVYGYLKTLSGEKYKYDPNNPQIDEETFYKDVLYNTNTIDDIFINVTNSLTANLTTESGSLTANDRYIDRAAQFAYINFPYSSQQKDFVATAVKNQAAEISLLVMLYQDFMGRRAAYYDELYEAKAQTETDAELLSSYKEGLNSYYAARENELNTLVCGTENVAGVLGKINNWLDSKIYIQNTLDSSYLYYDSYLGTESEGKAVLVNNEYYDNLDYNFYYNESKEGRLGEHIEDITWSYGWDYINEYITPAIEKANKNPSIYESAVSFKKNAVVKAVTGSLAEIVTVAFLDSEEVGEANLYLKKFDMKWDINNKGDYHVPSDDYYNLVMGEYTDGTNTYTSIKNAEEFKGLINSTYYQAKGSVPGNVFTDLVSYSGSNPAFLLTSEYPVTDEHGGLFVKTVYSGTKGLDLKSQKTYSDTWTTETNCQYYLQSDREGDENRTNQMYAVLLTVDSERTYSKMDFVAAGDGSYTYTVDGVADDGTPVYDATSGKVLAGTTAKVTITPEKFSEIKKVTVQYHNDASDSSKVTSEKTLFDSSASYQGCVPDENGELSFGYPVTYSNVTFVVEVERKAFETDTEGNFIIKTYDDLMKMATRVNSGEEKYVKGSYIVVNDIQCEVSAWEPIGTNEDGFLGKFDGQGHKITGLNTLPLTSARDGLFSVVGEGAVVENVVLSRADLNTDRNEAIHDIGGIAQENMGIIRKCIVIDSVIASQSGTRAGGIVAKNTTVGTVEACAVINTTLERNIYNMGTGGIADANSGTVNGCYVYNCTFSNPANNGDYNGVIIRSGNEPANSCYYTTSAVNNSYGTALTQEEFASGKATYLLNGEKSDDSVLWFQNIDNGLVADIYPVLADNDKNTVFKVSLENKEYSNYPTGESTLVPNEDGVFEIYTYEDLELVSASINTGIKEYVNGKYRVMADITVGDNWIPAGTKDYAFAGEFDGNGFTIDNLHTTDLTIDKVGLFGYIAEEGRVNNVKLTGVDLTVNIRAYAGAVAAYNNGIIDNCSVEGEISTVQWNEGDGYSVSNAGGITAVNYGTIRNSFNNCSVAINRTSLVSMVYIGGIAAMNCGVIEHCGNTANLETSSIMVGMGGIAGKNSESLAEYSVNNCYNTGNQAVNSVDPEFVDLDFVNRYLAENGASITVESLEELNELLSEEASVQLGGLVGDSNSAVVKNSYSTGAQMSFYEGEIGGLYGRASAGAVTNSYYLVGDNIEQTDSTMKYASQFESGEVAHKLEKGNTESVWGQKSNTTGSLPCFTSLALYKVAELEAGGYSVAGLGDINGDTIVDVSDYQELVNVVVSGKNSSGDTENHLGFIRADLNNDGYIDALDAADMDILMNGKDIVSVYAPGDFDGDGTATAEDAQNIRKAYEEALYINKSQQFACDINGDGFFNAVDLEKL